MQIRPTFLLGIGPKKQHAVKSLHNFPLNSVMDKIPVILRQDTIAVFYIALPHDTSPYAARQVSFQLVREVFESL